MELLKGKYGHFTDEGAAYCIEDWKTPRPWINVIANGQWGLTVSQAGGGYSWLNHSMLNRVTRWNQDILKDQDGKFLILRDEETGKSWSIAPQPLKPDYQSYQCKHGLGYTTFYTRCEDITAEWTLFVPQNKACETWKVRLINHSERPRQITLMPYFELLLGVFPDWHHEFHNLFLRTSFDESRNALIAENTLWSAPLPGEHGWNKDWPFRFFFLSSNKPESYTCDKEEFFGRNGDWRDATAVFAGSKFSNRTGTGFEQIVSQRHSLSLKPGETRDLTFVLGVLARERFEAEIPAYIDLLTAPDTALEEVKAHWLELCSRLTVDTPDQALNIMVNYWLKYQTISCRLLGRTAYYQCGGAFGFRDQLQDSQIWLTLDPAKTRQQILTHASHQQSDGTVQHWWHPISEEGRLTDITDDLLWLPFVVFNYLKETGDKSILDESVVYLDKGAGSIFDHCERAIKKALDRLSPRGLSLMGEGDWNDGMNGVGKDWKGESIWLSHFLIGILNDFSQLCRESAGKSEEEAFYRNAAKDLQKAVLEHAFEGDWFIRATTDNGDVLGSKRCKEGKIFLNAQTWAIINGVVDGSQAQSLLDHVEKHLYKDYGVLLFTPAYTVVDKNIGYLTRYSPGVRENGGVYTHAAIWAMWAQDKAGRGEKVYDTFKRLCPPLLSNARPDKYMGEPYVTPGNIEGPESLNEGRGAWTWYSGSSGWLYKSTIDNLLGIKPDGDKLTCKPNMPADWNGFTAERQFRGKTYRIVVKRVKSGSSELDIKISPL
ncbi:MAG: glycosyl transferase family 36 [Candidatus Riflebacteria bacterium]|nr:glycosyl transferase family 36 [Candidatus Riflebacteria bacterium]